MKNFKTSRFIGSRIKKRRTELRLSQEKLAEALDVTYQQVQRYENGSNLLNTDKLQSIAEFLDVPVSYFFDESVDKVLPKAHMSLSADEIRLIRLIRESDKKVLKTFFEILKLVKK